MIYIVNLVFKYLVGTNRALPIMPGPEDSSSSLDKKVINYNIANYIFIKLKGNLKITLYKLI